MLLLCWALVKELREDPGAGPARHHALHGMRDAVTAMVGDALTDHGPARHPGLRRVAESPAATATTHPPPTPRTRDPARWGRWVGLRRDHHG